MTTLSGAGTDADGQTMASAAVEAFAGAVLAAPWGSVSKGELDLMIFTLLLDSGKLDEDMSDFAIADKLRITPARVRGLRFRYEQRAARDDPNKLLAMMVPKNFSFGRPDGDDYFDVSIHRTYLREYFASRLMAQRSVVYERTPAVLTVNREEFVRILIDTVCGTDWSDSVEGMDAYSALMSDLAASKNKVEYDNALGRLLTKPPQVLSALSGAFATQRGLNSLMASVFGLA